MGVGITAASNRRGIALADNSGLYDETQGFDKALRKGVDSYINLTGMNHWNDSLQTIAAVSASSGIIKAGRNLSKGKPMNAGDLARVRALGLSDQDMIACFKQWEKSGADTSGSTVLANVGKWQDAELAEKFGTAVNKRVRATIIEPGAGDLPLMMDSIIGKHALQFTSFLHASINRAALSGMQENRINLAVGILASLYLAHMSRHLKAFVDDPSGKTNDKIHEESAYTTVMESVDRSGMIPQLGLFNRYVTPATGYNITGSGYGRYKQMSEVRSNLVGPTGSSVERLSQSTAHIFHGEVGESVNDLSRVMPMQNLYGISFLLREFRGDN